MMRSLFHIFLSFVLLMAVNGCQVEVMPYSPVDDPVGVVGDMIKLKFNVKAPDDLIVDTRAAHPDGKGIRTIDILCFDADGSFLDSISGTIENTDEEHGEAGRVSAEIPHKTRIMHVVCNVPPFASDAFKGLTEAEVIEHRLGGQSDMVYWARVEVPSDVEELYTNVTDGDKRNAAEAVLDWLTIETNPTNEMHKGVPGKGNPIVLLRNQAKITMRSINSDEAGDAWSGDYFVITGYVVNHNTLSGTVAPLEPESQCYPTYNSSSYDITDWAEADYIHLPQDASSVELEDVSLQNLELRTDRELYIFESPNTMQAPLDIIIRGYNIIGDKVEDEKYYKLNLVDEDFNLLPIRRNHHYMVSIEGNLYYGVETLEEALLPTTPATNNVWIYIADEVTSVISTEYRLSVEDYLVVVDSEDVQRDPELALTFTVEDVNNDGVSSLDDFEPQVSWYGEQDISNTTDLKVQLSRDSDLKMTGTITLTVKPAGDDNNTLSGSVLVKYSHLQRKINLRSICTQRFSNLALEALPKEDDAPATNYREKVRMTFSVPDSYPEGLYPFNVLLSTNAFTLLPQDGQKVSIVTNLEEGYGDSFKDIIDGKEVYDTGYKFVITITGPGEQTFLLQSIYTEREQSDQTQFVAIEANHFNRMSAFYSIFAQ